MIDPDDLSPLRDLAAAAAMAPHLPAFLHAAVRTHQQILVSGDAAVDKTPLVQTLSGHVDGRPRANTIPPDVSPDTAGCEQGNQAVLTAVRHNLQRIVIGTVRDAAVAVLQAPTGGSTISAVEAPDPQAALARITAPAELSPSPASDSPGPVDLLIVHLAPDGPGLRPVVDQILEVTAAPAADRGPTPHLIYDVRQPARPLTASMSAHLQHALSKQGWADA